MAVIYIYYFLSQGNYDYGDYEVPA